MSRDLQYLSLRGPNRAARLSLILVAVSASLEAAHAQMDHCSPNNALTTSTCFGVIQSFADFPAHSSTVIDDFAISGTNPITQLCVAFETSPGLNVATIPAWQISIWSSHTAAANSGSSLTGDIFSLVSTPATYTSLAGTGAVGPAWRADFNVNLALGPGVYWIGMAAILPFAAGQVWILDNTAPPQLGNGTALNSYGINPGNGFGNGNCFPGCSNAAYAVTAVPEPAAMVALATGLTALLKRRKKS